MISQEDIRFMQQAMALAQRGEGAVNPNPLVGALVVRNGEVVAQGYHERYGDLHAERNAFRDADSRGIGCEGTTLYVTLEPCCHHGHQPPCTEAIIEHRVGRVVVGLPDPNPLVAGKGLKQVADAGIAVDILDAQNSSEEALLVHDLRYRNRVFLKYITTGRPWVVMKYAMTLDGKICTRTGDSRWVSGPESRQEVHRLRRRLKAILCGIGTVLADDPMLNTRLDDDPSARNPIRIVADRRARIPMQSQLVQTARQIPVAVACGADADPRKLQQLEEAGVQIWICNTPEELLDRAGKEHIDGIMLEGGGTLNESFVHAGLVDEVYAFVAPKLVGGQDARTPVEGLGLAHMAQALQLREVETRMFGKDILIHGLV
jgi:diaminohydroxyphosphoribosylaminopyrimidine deaminase/5-amino-6-(5-phosphoribosylamino)uracil reductase